MMADILQLKALLYLAAGLVWFVYGLKKTILQVHEDYRSNPWFILLFMILIILFWAPILFDQWLNRDDSADD